MSLYSKALNWAESFQKIGEETSSGKLVSLFNSIDIPTFDVKYIYAITVPNGRVKGPYLHEKRTTIMTPLLGSVDFIYRDNITGSYGKVVLCADKPVQLVIPSGTGFCILGVSSTSIIVNICDYPWYPDSQECRVPGFLDCPYIKDILT